MAKRALAVLLIGAVAWGCATQQGVVRDGKTYGVTKGAFRGRWWSYYERGTSWLSGELYEEAEADLKQALVGRSRDAWQARMYGLHFVEYFPNRELGVVYYHTDRLAEAEEYLKTSLEQIDTARAHHYLDLVAKAKIAKGELQDTDAPSLRTSIEDGLLISTRDLSLDINTSDDTGVSRVRVNGEQLPQRGSAISRTFEDDLLLTEGTHEIRVEVNDLADKETTQTVKVLVDLTGPNIGVFSPRSGSVTEDASVLLEGTCVDKNGVVSVALGDRSLAESKGEKQLDFGADLPLEDGENSFVVVAKDAAGNQTKSTITVFKGKPDSVASRLWLLSKRAPHLLQYASTHGLDALAPAVLSRVLSGAVEGGVAIELKSPVREKPYRHNKTLHVRGDVVANTKVASLSINGEAVEGLASAPQVSFNRGLSIPDDKLAQGRATMPLSVLAKDEDGNETRQEFEVSLEPVMLNDREFKMAVAVLPFDALGVDPKYPTASYSATIGSLVDGARFSLVERAELDAVLVEQQISAAGLADPNQAIRVGKLLNAHTILIASLTEWQQSGLEIDARAVSTETGIIEGHFDVFIEDKEDREQVQIGCRTLADQFQKAYPRLSGEVVKVVAKSGGAEMALDWTEEEGARKGSYLFIVYKEYDEFLEEDTEIPVAKARLVAVGAKLSKAKEVEWGEDGQEHVIEQGMAAITM